MKKWTLFSSAILLLTLIFSACTADYDTFDSSDYCTLNEIHFEEEASNPSIYSSEHKIIVTLEDVPDSLDTWDSVTVNDIDMSSMASLYLVESKFEKFPQDSLELDSLANKVAFSDKKIKEDSKIRLPKSHAIYVLIISESGEKAIWQIKFEIPGVKAETESSSSVTPGEESSGSTMENSDTSLELKFAKALEVVISGDSILVEFPQGTDLTDIVLETSSVQENAKVSPDPSSIKDWSKPQEITVTAEDGTEKTWIIIVSSVKSGATDFQIAFEKQFKVNRSNDTIYLKLENGESIENAVVNSWSVSNGAVVLPNPDSVTTWEEYQTFNVTAENGTEKSWVVALSIAEADEKVSSDKELISISANGEISAATIDSENKTVVLHLANASALTSVSLEISVSSTASHNLSADLDLRTPQTLIITAEDMSTAEWTISADYPSVAPEITEIAIGSGKVAGTIDQETGTIFFNMDFNTDKDLRSLAVSSLTLSEGASTSDIKSGSSYNFAKKLEVTVANASGDSKTYKLQAGYQYPGSNFNSWKSDAFGNTNDVEGWDNGNNSAMSSTKTLTINENQEIVKMESINAKIFGIGRFASGNMLVAYFNPKNEEVLKLTQYDDGNELIDFGRPFYGRPAYVEFDVKYEGSGDSCDLYVLLEHRSRTSNEGKNQYRTSSDVNTLVASAWYRATTVESTEDPDVVSITDASRTGYKTIRLKFKYGTPESTSPIYNSSVFSTSLLHSNGIDNHLVETTSPDDFDVTHIRVVMASSAQGQLYKGTVGATLWCDEMRLIYE